MKITERIVWAACLTALATWTGVRELRSRQAPPAIVTEDPEPRLSPRSRTADHSFSSHRSGTGAITPSSPAAVLASTDPVLRMSRFLQMISSADFNQAKEIAEMLRELKARGIALPAEEDLLNFRLGQLGGDSLFPAMDSSPSLPEEIAARRKQLEGWAQADPSAARSWLDRLPPGRYRDQMSISWMAVATRDDPAGSMELASSLHPSQQAAAARAVAARIAETREAGDATSLLASLEPQADGHSAPYLRVLFDSLAMQGDSAAAARLIDEHLDQAYVTPLSLTKAAAGMGRENPGAALDWAASIESRKPDLPPGEMLAAAIDHLTLAHLSGAEEWAATHPEQPGIERMRTALARKRSELEDERGDNPDEYQPGD